MGQDIETKIKRITEKVLLKTQSDFSFQEAVYNFSSAHIPILKKLLKKQYFDDVEKHVLNLNEQWFETKKIKYKKHIANTEKDFTFLFLDTLFYQEANTFVNKARNIHSEDNKRKTSLMDKIFQEAKNVYIDFFNEYVTEINLNNFIKNCDKFLFQEELKSWINDVKGPESIKWYLLESNAKYHYNPGFEYDDKQKKYVRSDLHKSYASFDKSVNDINDGYNLGFTFKNKNKKAELVKEIIESTIKQRDSVSRNKFKAK